MKNIKIGDRLIAVRPTVLTPVLFKRKTNNDLLKVLTNEDVGADSKLEYIVELFYIMAMQATCQDVKLEFEKATDEIAYYEFIDSIDSSALFSKETLKEIVQVYMATATSTSISKN